MFKIKHLMDEIEPDDGQRLWIESCNLTRDMREWCKVDHVVTHFGPPSTLTEWFEEHPDGYDFFRSEYHDALSESKYFPVLRSLAAAALKANFTLLHSGDLACENSATALYEFLSNLQAFCPPDPGEDEAD